VDECQAQLDACDQNCHNTVGSYTCSCNSGYILDSDRVSCDGTSFSLNPLPFHLIGHFHHPSISPLQISMSATPLRPMAASKSAAILQAPTLAAAIPVSAWTATEELAQV